jgi:hypothetical protein
MSVLRLAAACFTVLVLAASAQAEPRLARTPSSPKGLKPFLVRVDEAQAHSFSRTPSFAWAPVRNAALYEFELATSDTFDEGSIVFSANTLKTPAVAVTASLPWLTGKPYALYAHVRAIAPDGATSQWSAPYGLNMRWSEVPAKLPGDEYPGLVQWTPVDGASAYDVWFMEPNKIIRTKTNAADEREYYTFHQGSPWPDVVHWRVRAVRKTYGALPNFLPTVTYGPWSPMQTSTNPPFETGFMHDVAATSDATSTDAIPTVHRLTPGFAFNGNTSLDGKPGQLYRVYVFSDSDCVNVVFKGALVGSPAYAPRMTGPLNLPGLTNQLFFAPQQYLPDGVEGKTYMRDSSAIQTTEADKPVTNPASGDDTSSGAAPDPAATPPPSEATSPLPGTPKESGAPIDLWDSGWPNGRFYWTVVPAEPHVAANLTTFVAVRAKSGDTQLVVNDVLGFGAGATVVVGDGETQELALIVKVEGRVITFSGPLVFFHEVGERVFFAQSLVDYHELDMPQDACAAGRVQAFGKTNEPAVTVSGAPFVTGLSPTGRLVQAAGSNPSFYGSPLVAWKPALGADEYQIQWSPSRYPWRPVDPITKDRYEKLTFATSALLDRKIVTQNGAQRGPLPPGTWWYRVRGLDFSLPGTARAMSWSKPVMVRITKPKFSVVGKNKKKR